MFTKHVTLAYSFMDNSFFATDLVWLKDLNILSKLIPQPHPQPTNVLLLFYDSLPFFFRLIFVHKGTPKVNDDRTLYAIWSWDEKDVGDVQVTSP